MAPAAEGQASSGDAVPVEIPVDLIRALNVRGKMTLDAAQMSGLEFENVDLGHGPRRVDVNAYLDDCLQPSFCRFGWVLRRRRLENDRR